MQMLLVFLGYMMKFVDINKLQSQRCTAATGGTCINMLCCQHHGQHVAELRKHLSSNSSSTSSGCDSAGSSSSKENFYVHNKLQKQQEQQHSITPQQLQQLHFYQQLQRKQLLLLQKQLLKRRQLQQQQQRVLQQMGVKITNKSVNTSTVPLTCNQQYLLQLRLQQQQQQQQQNVYNNINKIDNICYNDSDVINNNNNNNNNNANFKQNDNLFGGVGGFECNESNGIVQGQKFRRGMTEFPTKNDTKQKSHLSQPLQNSPSRHQHNNLNLNTISSQHFASNINNKILTNKNTTLQAASIAAADTKTLANISRKLSATPTSPPTSAQHSPLHYKKPLNSPNNSPFAHAYTRASTISQQQQLQQQQQQQQKLLSVGYNNKPQQQYLNDILAQQQHLQQQQQQLLQVTPNESDERDGELSEESLKQNVAIVLNNLDRYNNALRSIILNEQVTTNSYLEDILVERQEVENNNNNNNNNSNIISNNNNFLQISGEELIMATAATPESDYNSNATTPGSARCYDNNMLQQHTNMVGCNNGVGNSNNALINAGNIGGGNIMSNNLNCSLASEHDFTHDNSDYQWFLDYGYRDGCNGMQRSVLSSLSASYNTMGDLIYYEDIAKNLDANLAEVDMESFQAQDINSLLWQLPSYCQRLASGNQRLQQSLLMQQQQQQQLQQQQQQQQQQYLYEQQHKLPQHVSQTSTTSTNELIENSICKSELLFSPVKETHLSVVSLDMENYPDDGDIILTCKANKENYTIAFEGSVLYSDDSYYEPAEITLKNKQNFINLHSNLNEVQRKALDVSMSRSEQVAHNCQNNRMQRYPSGNNNTTETSILPQFSPTHKKVRKSNSLPNLGDLHSEVSLSTSKSKIMCCSSTHSSPKHMPHQATTRQQQAEEEVLRNMLPMCRIPVCCDSMLEENTQPCAQHQVQQIQQGQQQAHYHHHHRHKQHQQQQQQQMTSTATNSSSSGSSHTPAYNLVKMFIKQKSSNNCSIESAEAASAHTCMDISSGCWPSSDAAGSNCSNSSSLEQRLRKKSMHDSGKGSALSKHDEEELAAENCTNSPAKRQAQVMRHPQVSLLAQHNNNNNNNNNRSSGGSSYQSSSTSEQMTQMELGKMQTATPTASQERITRSMQTSCGTLSARSSFSERLRCIPPSFLAKLNNLGESKQAPIYVIYPNYALPDLGFVKTNASAEIIYESFNYKTAMSNAAETQTTSLKKRFSASSELLKQMDYKHVQDWQSLVTLLPAEYRQRLQHIPEVYEALKKLPIGEGQRPLFCMSPPVKHNRQHICDCVQYIEGQTQNNEACGGSSSSGSSQQPSSGYRGSSTLLTDSELDNVTADPLKQMYVYQYDQQRLDSGVECSPKTPTPQVKPRGILRRNNANKRSSMIEGGQQNYKLSKLEKRRSLQEPPYTQTTVCSSEELEEVFEDEELYTTPKSRKERLSRRDADALARARAENFLSSVPRGELKYYAEIAAILESTEGQSQIPYDAAALKKEVSHLLSQQKKVSFNDETVHKTQPTIFNAETQKRFSTPPNSPNISMANGHNALKTQNGNSSAVKRYSTAAKPATLDAKQQLKLENNRFKRLQIQWELMSKDSSMLKELAAEHQTKSGGSTPTAGPTANKSRIPRPVSYPAGKKIDKNQAKSNAIKPKTPDSSQIARIHEQEGKGNHARSPSRIVPPKRYGNTTPTSATQVSPLSPVTPTIANRSRTPTSRTPLTAPNTPKRQVPAPRLTSRPR